MISMSLWRPLADRDTTEPVELRVFLINVCFDSMGTIIRCNRRVTDTNGTGTVALG
jgi:hypothetical protein